MYLDHFGLSGQPFQLGPDPRFFFGSRGHRKALAYLTYGLEQGEGFVIITGEVGAGKTTMIQHLLTMLDQERYVVGQIVTTQTGADDTLRLVAAAFGLDAADGSKATLLTRLEAHFVALHQCGRRPLLIVDEVQNLALASLEELRMLSNFESSCRALLQTLLVGQPQFRQMLAGAELEQLCQRVTASYHLGPLDRAETEGYIRHRLQMVGWAGKPGMTPQAFDAIQDYTGGVPRKINTLCTRLLLFAFLDHLSLLDGAVVVRVAEELRGELTAGAPAAAEPEPPPLDLTAEIEGLKHRLDVLERGLRSNGREPARASLASQLLRLRDGIGRGRLHP